MNITVIVPMHNQHSFTNRCVQLLQENATDKDKLHIIVVDDNSSPAYTNDTEHVEVLQYSGDSGVLNLYKYGTQHTWADVVIWIHNDCYIWEQGWDTRIREAFKNDPKLGLMGLFGGRGVSADGGRGYPCSNMVGREIGTHGRQHGYLETGLCPAVIFDSYAMIFRASALEDTGIDPRIPHHFFYDRIIPLDMIKKGWNCAVIGIEHDHAGGTTSCSVPMADWLEVYNEGLALFQSKHGDLFNFYVDKNYNYITTPRIL